MLATEQTRISFVHSEIPECVSPVVSYHPDFPQEYRLGVHGTGFFARKFETVVFITARHCLTGLGKESQEDLPLLASRLLIPYTPSGFKCHEDYVRFSEVISFSHHSEELPGEYVDAVILIVDAQPKSSDYEKLLSRAVNLPPTGEWFDKFCETPLGEQMLIDGKGISFVVSGYPLEGTETKVTQEDGVVHQKVNTSGYLKPGFYPHTMSLRDIVWEHDLNGFSGSPVFVQYGSGKEAPQHALAGMIVNGGNKQAQFIRISQMLLQQI